MIFLSGSIDLCEGKLEIAIGRTHPKYRIDAILTGTPTTTPHPSRPLHIRRGWTTCLLRLQVALDVSQSAHKPVVLGDLRLRWLRHHPPVLLRPVAEPPKPPRAATDALVIGALPIVAGCLENCDAPSFPVPLLEL